MKLFMEYDLREVLARTHIKMQSRIDGYSNDEIMANELELLADNCFEEYKFETVNIGEEEFCKRTVVQKRVKRLLDSFYRERYNSDYVEVDGVKMNFFFPYIGDDTLFKCSASTFSLSGYPKITLKKGYLIFEYEYPLNEIQGEEKKDIVIKKLNRDVESVKSGISYANKDVEEYNKSLRSVALNCLRERKKKIEQYYSISQMFEVPLQKSEYASTNIPMQRKIAPIAQKFNNEPSYCITDTEYDFILKTIKHNGSTYERTPASFLSMQEEDLRNMILAALNGMYQGGATGETFRNKGKTDICIEKENRAAFVAECKMWTGQKAVLSAVNQLDGYLTWRDCKTALIYFVRNKDFFKVLESASKALKEISSMRQVKELDKNEYDCSLVSIINPGQIVKMRVIFFNLFS